MSKIGIITLPTLLLVGLLAAQGLNAQTPPPAPDFREVYDLIKAHLPDVNETDLNRTAVRSLIAALSPKVSLVGDSEKAAGKDTPEVSHSSLFEGSIAYIRVTRVGDALDKAVRQAWQELGATNKLNGLVVDLRYADGTDYAAAVATADMFVKKEQPLLDWGQGLAHSKEKTDSIDTPLAVLVNEKTSAAAEALAAIFRETGAGLILGGRTAGEAMIAQEYPLKDGERLRIATTPIQLGDGTSLTGQGIKPDIAVEVSGEDEHAYYSDPFKEIARGKQPSANLATNNVAQTAPRARRPRFNEAELVREKRDGLALDSDFAAGPADSEKPAVRDPVLARALDFLKGLSVMRQTRS